MIGINISISIHNPNCPRETWSNFDWLSEWSMRSHVAPQYIALHSASPVPLSNHFGCLRSMVWEPKPIFCPLQYAFPTWEGGKAWGHWQRRCRVTRLCWRSPWQELSVFIYWSYSLPIKPVRLISIQLRFLSSPHLFVIFKIVNNAGNAAILPEPCWAIQLGLRVLWQKNCNRFRLEKLVTDSDLCIVWGKPRD